MSNNKFGMFIHWGLYAQTELQEQAIARYNIPRDEYEALINSFDPVNYDPEAWVLLAKKCGMQYICFTTKHHDGFCMWDTKYTDYNIMNTPYGKDVLKLLADACKKHDMKLSLYYSNPDWHHYYGYNPKSTHQWQVVQRDEVNTEAYREYLKNQVTELLTNYGPIYTMFWDIPPQIHDESINQLVRSLQPGIFINDRGFDTGDFSTPEREYEAPGGARFTRMTEACNSIDMQSWGYRKDATFYSIRHLTSSIDKMMAMGGSYLLNIGPKADGSLDPTHVARLETIGDWYGRMEGCLVDHEADEYEYNIIGGEWIATKKNGRSYFHFHNGTCGTAVVFTKYPNRPKKVRLMNSGSELRWDIELLPEFVDGNTGFGRENLLHIKDIDVDKFASEPIVIEVEW